MTPGAILLAAGGSRRMGSPKQLLVYRGEPLVRRAARTVLAAGFAPLCVVLGHQPERVAAALDGLDVATCVNPDWARGIGSSLRTGVVELERLAPEAPGALVVLADQPGVTPGHLAALAEGFQSGAKVVASAYNGTLGVPALFDRSLFADLRGLPDESGAKGVIAAQTGSVRSVALETAHDIDLPEDFARLIADTSF